MTLQPQDVDENLISYKVQNNGKEPTEWEQIAYFNNLGCGIVSVDGYFGSIDSTGKIIIPLEYSNLIDFDDEELVLACNNDGFWGFVNWKNEIIIPLVYSYASIFDEGLSMVCKNDKYGFINRGNKEVIPSIY